MHQAQKTRITRARSLASCLPVPIRYECNGQSVKVQLETSTYDHPEQLRHRSRIALRRFKFTTVVPSLLCISTITTNAQAMKKVFGAGRGPDGLPPQVKGDPALFGDNVHAGRGTLGAHACMPAHTPLSHSPWLIVVRGVAVPHLHLNRFIAKGKVRVSYPTLTILVR